MLARVAASVFQIVFLLQICLKCGIAKLLTTSLDTEVMVNDSVYLNCSTSDSSLEIHWQHNGKYVYAGGKLFYPYDERFQMRKCPVGEYNLFIPSAKPEDAGRYECRDKEGSGQSHSIELTVLAANPVCTTYMKSDGLIGSNTCTVENEKVQFSCSVAFYGQPPKMKWSSVENYDHLTNFSCKENDRQLICNLTMKAEQKLNGSSYVCHTTRATSGHYQCTTEALQIIGPAAEKATECSTSVLFGLIVAAFAIPNVSWVIIYVIQIKRKSKRRTKRKEDVEHLNRDTTLDDLEIQLKRKDTDIEFYKTRYRETKEQLEQTSKNCEDQIKKITDDLELYNRKNREQDRLSEQLAKDLALSRTQNQKKIEELEKKHMKDRDKWEEEKKTLLAYT